MSNHQDDDLVLKAISSFATPVKAGQIAHTFNSYPRAVLSLEGGSDRRLDRSLSRLKRGGHIEYVVGGWRVKWRVK